MRVFLCGSAASLLPSQAHHDAKRVVLRVTQWFYCGDPKLQDEIGEDLVRVFLPASSDESLNTAWRRMPREKLVVNDKSVVHNPSSRPLKPDNCVPEHCIKLFEDT